MDKNKDEIIQVNDKKYTILKCKECSGKFWSYKSYIMHWSCNGNLRCSYCFMNDHTITICDLRLMCDKQSLKEHIQ